LIKEIRQTAKADLIGGKRWERMQSKTEKDARRAAEDAQCDRTLFVISSDAYAAIVKRFDEMPKPNERLRRTMRTTPPWEREKR